MPYGRSAQHRTRRRQPGQRGIGREAARPGRRPPRWLPIALLAVVLGVGGAAFLLTSPRPGEPVAWSRLGTQDVHSLAFVGDDAGHLLFGHHNGIAESRDGGRTWTPLPVRDDAMAMSAAGDGSIVIAGHEVFRASRDGGKTWAPIDADLPSLDIHGFARDPADAARMWAYLATGGLWESTDFGARWTRVREDNVLFPVAVREGAATRLLGLDISGLITSTDGGLTWSSLGLPPGAPLMSLVATPDGRTVYLGSGDGIFRSDDGGRSWTATAYKGTALALATTPDGRTVGVVSRETEFFRSTDAGATWPGPG